MIEIITYLLLSTVLVVVVIFFKISYKKRAKWIDENEPVAFHKLNVITGGRRWVGRNLSLVHTKSIKDENHLVFKEQLCKTKTDEYISIQVVLNLSEREIEIGGYKVLSEKEVKTWLEPYADKYVEIFGEPELAG